MVQWMDVNQLSQEENLHSKCLCINRLPLDLSDSEELAQLFSETYKPVFCQVRALVRDEASRPSCTMRVTITLYRERVVLFLQHIEVFES